VSRFLIGIDLGTTNTVLSYIDTEQETSGQINLFPVPQIVAPGEVAERNLLPSFIYITTEHEKKAGGLNLPWDPFGERVVGEYARKRGAEVPGRLISSAKSWLCHKGVDRTAPILPLEASEDVQKLSPIASSATFLRHLKAAWNHSIGKETGANIEEQEIYLTIPASFDAVARELTLQAARSAGFENITLLEEPQAAFYAWLHANQETWKDLIKPGDLILVCDVGGGTTDFSLIRVTDEEGELGLKRLAVGDHLLLGGDNMDLALAYYVSEELKKKGTKLDRMQFQVLIHATRLAKEQLLSDPSLEQASIVIPGRGTGLVGGTIKTELSRETVDNILVQGFFPQCGKDEMPIQRPKTGLQELGLPYVDDTAITKHLAAFLATSHLSNNEVPTAILFNGGVFKSELLRNKLFEVIQKWEDQEQPTIKELANPDMDLSVSLGAAYFGLVSKGEGLKIRGGIARSYYLGIESSRPAVPGLPPEIKALCIVPQGMEEGESIQVPDKTFGLLVGQTVEFLFLASRTRQDDKPGDIIEDWEDSIEQVSKVQTSLDSPDIEPGTLIPVQIEAELTEIGTLAIYLVSKEHDQRFKLEFNVRDGGEA